MVQTRQLWSMVWILLLFSCTQNSGPVSDQKAQEMTSDQLHDVDIDVCKQFDADFVYTALQIPIVRVQPSDVPGVFGCNYYTEYSDTFFTDDTTGKNYPGGKMISMVIEHINIDRQKKNMETMGLTVSSDTRISMTNLIARRVDGSLWAAYLFTNQNRFLTINLLQKPDISDDALIDFVSKVADRIQGKTIPLQKNPGITVSSTNTNVSVPPLHQEGIVHNFFNLISEGKIVDAVNMMDANDTTKQAWAVNFNVLQSLAVTNVEPVYQDEWTDTRQIFKVTVDVSLKPVENSYGWDKGVNTRWVTVQLNNVGKWDIHELANSP